MKKTRAIFREEIWDIKYQESVIVDNEEVAGSHDHSTRTIAIDKNLAEFEIFEAHIHEASHALFPDVCETIIGLVSHELALFLWKLGYRKGFITPTPKKKAAKKK